MKELVGKTVNKILIGPNDEVLVFETNDGPIAYQTEGDCCSSTWVESITGVEALLGKSVNKEESIDMQSRLHANTNRMGITVMFFRITARNWLQTAALWTSCIAIPATGTTVEVFTK